MIRVYTSGQDGRIQGEIAYAKSPVEAEALYWRLCAQRTAGPGVVHIHPASPVDLAVATGRYRIDADWRGPRELDADRWQRLWALPMARTGPWGGVRPHEIQGIIDAAGWPQTIAAQMMGVNERSFRRWVLGERAMDYPTWVLLRDLAQREIEQVSEIKGK